MKRLAAIDIGTNTALLLIADVSGEGVLQPLFQEELIVRLGEGVDRNRKLNYAAIARTLAAIQLHLEKVQERQAELVAITGTSALRDAINRAALADQIEKGFGVELRILSGKKEAELTYFGALSNKPSLEGEIVLLDIGGGSTECIVGTTTELLDAISIDIGSVRLTERCLRGDPPEESELVALRELIRRELEHAFSKWRFSPKHFVGVAGTVTTLAAVHFGLAAYDGEKVDGTVLSRDVVKALVKRFAETDLLHRQRPPGLKPERADVILAGAMILNEAMEFFRFEQVLVSDRGLRFGVLLEAASHQSQAAEKQ